MSGEARRRRFGISLKLMMLLVLASGLLLGWRVNRAREQRHVLELVEIHGGSVLFDWQYRNGEDLRLPKPPGPKSLRELIGAEYFQEITYLKLGPELHDGTQGTDSVDDTVLAQLKGLDKLEYLGIGKARRITDHGLANLRNLGSLRCILLEGARQVTDVGLSHITTNKDLEYIAIAGSRITSRGFRKVGTLRSLKSIDLADPELNDEDLAAIRDLTHLGNLFLGSCPITDRGLENLREMKELHFLYVRDSRISDRGLASLSARPELWSLSLPGNRTVTADGIARYRAAKPVNHLAIDGGEDGAEFR